MRVMLRVSEEACSAFSQHQAGIITSYLLPHMTLSLMTAVGEGEVPLPGKSSLIRIGSYLLHSTAKFEHGASQKHASVEPVGPTGLVMTFMYDYDSPLLSADYAALLQQAVESPAFDKQLQTLESLIRLATDLCLVFPRLRRDPNVPLPVGRAAAMTYKLHETACKPLSARRAALMHALPMERQTEQINVRALGHTGVLSALQNHEEAKLLGVDLEASKHHVSASFPPQKCLPAQSCTLKYCRRVGFVLCARAVLKRTILNCTVSS
jgi:hypothetical protein